MVDWILEHPWMTFVIALILVGNGKIVIDLRRRKVTERKRAPITPDQARAHMLTPRERAAKVVAAEIDRFMVEGNPDRPITITLDRFNERALIAELLERKRAGWHVEFHRGRAVMSLPEVVS